MSSSSRQSGGWTTPFVQHFGRGVRGCDGQPFGDLVADEHRARREYNDYQQPGRRVTLHTTLAAKRAGGQTLLDFTFDDGPGKTVYSHDAIALEGKALRWGDVEKPQQFRVLEQAATKIIAEVDGQDDDAPALIRETFTLEGDTLTILKMVQPTGGTMVFRHEYRLKRVAP